MNKKYISEISWLFNKYEREQLEYCILRGYEYLPIVKGHDIDLIVLKKDWHKHREVINEMNSLFNLNLTKKIFMPYAKRFYLNKKSEPDHNKQLILDYHFDEEWLGAVYLEYDDLPKKKYKDYIVVEPYIQPLLPFVTYLLSTGEINEKYFDELVELSIKYKHEMLKIFTIILGNSLGFFLLEQICIANRENIIAAANKFRYHILANSFKKNPICTMKKILELGIKILWYKKILGIYPP